MEKLIAENETLKFNNIQYQSQFAMLFGNPSLPQQQQQQQQQLQHMNGVFQPPTLPMQSPYFPLQQQQQQNPITITQPKSSNQSPPSCKLSFQAQQFQFYLNPPPAKRYNSFLFFFLFFFFSLRKIRKN